jgi:thiamine-phosphate pyrophosphorylase
VRIYLVTQCLPADALEPFLSSVISAGVGMVQLRDRTLSDRELLSAARRCARVCKRMRVPFIVNDRADIALAARADGLHVGQDDIPVPEARALLGPTAIIGLSTHSPGQIDAAAGSGADYIGVGPIHATPTKAGRPAVGLELVRYAAAHAAQPFFAIGGIEPGNVAQVVAAGGTRISVLRCITQARDPAAAVGALRAAIAAANRRSADQHSRG